MVITGALRVIVWMRQLVDEIGLNEFTNKPWSVFADNVQVNRICNEQCVLERSKPRKRAEHKPNDTKLENGPEVTRVFDKKLIRRCKAKPVDLVTEFTYMEVVDTGTPLNEA